MLRCWGLNGIPRPANVEYYLQQAPLCHRTCRHSDGDSRAGRSSMLRKWLSESGRRQCDVWSALPHGERLMTAGMILYHSLNSASGRPSGEPKCRDSVWRMVRQSWGTRIDLHDHHFLAIAAAEQELLHAEYEDYASANSIGIACCHSAALILMLLLLVRHILMVTRDAGMVQDVSALFNVTLQFAGFLLSCYVIVLSCYLIQCRRRWQECFKSRPRLWHAEVLLRRTPVEGFYVARREGSLVLSWQGRELAAISAW